jgi:hypothetical protein
LGRRVLVEDYPTLEAALGEERRVLAKNCAIVLDG